MKKLLLGAHTSAAGGAPNALLEGQTIEATTIQFFTSNQKQWHGRTISDEEVVLWEKTLQTSGISHVMSHAGYLINLGSPKHEILVKSQIAFREEILRCQKLKVSYLNFHPGAALDAPKEQCLHTIIESLLSIKDLTNKGDMQLLLETTAGQGSSIGSSFEELGFLISHLKEHIPIGVCIDTCHIFSAGYDIRTRAAWETTLDLFEKHIGLKYLQAFHVNDSMKPLGSRVDRHAPLGEGEIGLTSFQELMRHPKLKALPKYLETPGGPELWKKEIALLKDFAQ